MHVYVVLLCMRENPNYLAIRLKTLLQQIGEINYDNPYKVILSSLIKSGYWNNTEIPWQYFSKPANPLYLHSHSLFKVLSHFTNNLGTELQRHQRLAHRNPRLEWALLPGLGPNIWFWRSICHDGSHSAIPLKPTSCLMCTWKGQLWNNWDF
jgi:hypothetical protein